jgi:hypothetical protein
MMGIIKQESDSPYSLVKPSEVKMRKHEVVKNFPAPYILVSISVLCLLGCTSMEYYSQESPVKGYYFHGSERGGYLQLCDNKEFQVKYASGKLERSTVDQYLKFLSINENIPYVRFQGKFRTNWNLASADNSGFLITQVLEMRKVGVSDCKVKPMFSR